MSVATSANLVTGHSHSQTCQPWLTMCEKEPCYNGKVESLMEVETLLAKV